MDLCIVRVLHDYLQRKYKASDNYPKLIMDMLRTPSLYVRLCCPLSEVIGME